MDESNKGEQGLDVPRPSPVRHWRRRLRLPLMLLGPAIVVVVAAYFYLTGGRFEATDDAYVKTARVDISANVAGRVQELAVRDNQAVHKGDVLFRLDDAPFRIAVEEAGAQLAAARLQIEVLKANYRQRQSELASAQETLAFQQHELERQQRLLGSGIASQLQVDRVSHARDEAVTQVAGAQHQIGAVVASLGGNPNVAPDRHPTVQQAQALLDRAKLNLSYTVVTAPSDGVVTRVEQLQVGSYINASAPVFALVSTGDTWIEANFKEDQLTHMRVGQTARVEVDSYPGKTFEGRGGERKSGYRVAVLGIAPGKRDGKLGQGRAEASRAGGARTSRSGVSAAWRLKRQRQCRYSASAPSFRIGRSDSGQRFRCG